MFEEKDFLLELEVVLHEKEDVELLGYMKDNLLYVILRMNRLKLNVENSSHREIAVMQEDIDRMMYLYYTFLNLWVSRN